VAADLADRHVAPIHGDGLLIEIGKAALILDDQLRVERAAPIARDRQRHLRRARQHRLLRMAVTAIVTALSTLIVNVLVKLRIQNARRKRLLQIVMQPVLGEHLVRIAARKQLVQKFSLDSHVMILSFLSSWPCAQNS